MCFEGGEKVHLPSTIKTLPSSTFISEGSESDPSKSLEINLDSLTFIDHKAFARVYLGDTIRLPKNMKIWYTCSFYIKDDATIYIPKGASLINNRCVRDNSYNHYSISNQLGKALNIYVESPTPIEIRDNNSKYTLNNCTVHVPAGSSALYKKEDYFGINTVNAWAFAKEIIEDIPVTGIKIDTLENNVYVGDKFKLSIHIIPENADNKNFTVAPVDNETATVDAQGNVDAKAPGQVKVEVTSEDGNFKDEYVFNIFAHTTNVTFTDSRTRMKIGEEYSFTAQTEPLGTSDGEIVWTSNAPSVATVNNQGLVKAIAKGNAKITATAKDNNIASSVDVNVYQPVTEITLDKKDVTINAGETTKLVSSVLPTDADDLSVSWYSSDEDVATVSENGLITAKKAGKTEVYAVTNDEGLKASCNVTVLQPVTGVVLDKSSINLSEIGSSIQLTATVEPEDASNKSVKWSSSDTKVVIVSKGKAVCTGYGTAVISVVTEDGGYMATCIVNSTSGITDLLANEHIMIENGIVTFAGFEANTRLAVADMSGKVIFQALAEGKTVKTPQLSKGVYILTIANKHYKITI